MPDEVMLQAFNEQVLDKPEVFLARNEASAEQAKSVTKYLYDLGKSNSSSSLSGENKHVNRRCIFSPHPRRLSLSNQLNRCSFPLVHVCILGKSTETGSLKGLGSMLEELFVDGFDNDQIWEEIHMQNTPFLAYLKAEIKSLKFKKSGAQSAGDLEDEDEEAEGEEDEADMSLGLDEDDMGLEMDDTEGFSGEDELEEGAGSEGFSDEENLEEDIEEEEDKEDDDEEEEEEEDLDDLDLPVKKKSRTSEVDDDFFNLDEFNAMTEKQEQDELDEKEPDEDEEEIDYFADPDMIDSGDDDFDDEDMEENENEVDAHGTSPCFTGHDDLARLKFEILIILHLCFVVIRCRIQGFLRTCGNRKDKQAHA